jgi:hypothetical protein
MKISFDFDGILSEEYIQEIAKNYINDGHEVWITTSRLSDDVAPSKYWNRDLFNVATKLGIPWNRIQFTNGDQKWKFLKDFDLHYDDDKPTIDAIEEHLPSCVTVWMPDND